MRWWYWSGPRFNHTPPSGRSTRVTWRTVDTGSAGTSTKYSDTTTSNGGTAPHSTSRSTAASVWRRSVSGRHGLGATSGTATQCSRSRHDPRFDVVVAKGHTRTLRRRSCEHRHSCRPATQSIEAYTRAAPPLPPSCEPLPGMAVALTRAPAQQWPSTLRAAATMAGDASAPTVVKPSDAISYARRARPAPGTSTRTPCLCDGAGYLLVKAESSPRYVRRRSRSVSALQSRYRCATWVHEHVRCPAVWHTEN